MRERNLFDFLFPFLIFVPFSFFFSSLERKRRGKEEKRGNEESEKKQKKFEGKEVKTNGIQSDRKGRGCSRIGSATN